MNKRVTIPLHNDKFTLQQKYISYYGKHRCKYIFIWNRSRVSVAI